MARWSIFNNKPAPPKTAGAWCELCGPMTVHCEDVTLRICIDAPHAEYRFRCEGCGFIRGSEIASALIVDVLKTMGVTVEWFFLPAELYEDKTHPPITADDQADFLRELSEL